MCVCVCFSCFICHLQRFKGTEPVEEVTEQVKAVKIEEKPKEVKTEVVDEVLVQGVEFRGVLICHFCFCTYKFKEKPECLTPTVRGSGDSVMLWGAFCWHGLGPLVTGKGHCKSIQSCFE